MGSGLSLRELRNDTGRKSYRTPLMATTSARAWQRMLSGRRLDILDPSPLDVELDDIAHGLARVARWNGQTAGGHPFSVAQHSCLVEAIVAERGPGLPSAARLAAILHDAPEYVIGDVITPLKGSLGDRFAAIEARLLAAIHLRFGLPPALPDGMRRALKRADRIAAYLEATRLAGFSAEEADAVFGRPARLPACAEAFLSPWSPDAAADRFRARVAALATVQHAGDATVLEGDLTGKATPSPA